MKLLLSQIKRHFQNWEYLNVPNNTIISHIAYDNRLLDRKSTLFVPLKGRQIDAHQFISEAVNAGATISMCNKTFFKVNEDKLKSLPLILVPKTKTAIIQLLKFASRDISSKYIQRVPYFSQWESRELVEQFIKGHLKYREDPLWERSGATTPTEYEKYADSICGMACLKMALKFFHNKEIPLIQLTKQCASFGGYTKNFRKEGLIYTGLKKFVEEEFELAVDIYHHLPLEFIFKLISEGKLVIASSNKNIRTPETATARKGGHLILISGYNTTDNTVIFNNPSGFTSNNSQENVKLNIDLFKKFFANRAIAIYPN